MMLLWLQLLMLLAYSISLIVWIYGLIDPAAASVTRQSSSSLSSVLFLYCNNADSHLGSASTYLKALSERGHSVKVVRTVVGMNAPGEKRSKFRISGWPNLLIKEWNLEGYSELTKLYRSVVWEGTSGPLTPVDITAISNRAFGGFLLNYSAEVIVSLLNTHFDLIVIDAHYNVHGYAIADYHWRTHRTPYVMLHPSVLSASDAYAMALGGSWAANLAYFTPLPEMPLINDATAKKRDGGGQALFSPSRFWHRLENFLINLLELVGRHIIIPLRHFSNMAKLESAAGRQRESRKTPCLASFYRNAALHLVDSLIEPGYTTPTAWNLHQIGQECPPQSEKDRVLPPELKEFVEDPDSRGTIYVALGSFITWDNCPPGVIVSLLGALNSLSDYRVVFTAAPNETLSLTVGRHIRLVSWAPQFALLSHPKAYFSGVYRITSHFPHFKTRLFVTHGGAKSTREALCFAIGAAMCFLPMFSEQARTVKLAMRLGLGTYLNKFEIAHRPEATLTALHEALRENATYVENVKRLSRFYRNAGSKSPFGSVVNEAVWWSERVMQKKANTTPKLQLKAVEVQLWHSVYLTLIVFIAMAILLILS